ncbi:MAG: hypothetical protein KGD60_15285 [Candidatus Thorarchaeota archaeon]|nr:hypothetical protein [Candidatus Thorarchaeota archaeon]
MKFFNMLILVIRLAVIEDGRIIYDGPTKEALKRKEVTDNIGDWDQLREQIVSYRTNLIE